ncbi:MAG: hypothetical protein V4501_11115 [Pseudomonadota bacterium]
MTYHYTDQRWQSDIEFMKSGLGMAYMLKLARHSLVRLARFDDETDAQELIELAKRYDLIAEWLLGNTVNQIDREAYHAAASATYKRMQELKKLGVIE